MSGLDLPDPVVRHGAGPPVDAEALATALSERVDGEVRFDARSRAAYSTDASDFRQTPIGVVVPRGADAAVEAVAREHGAPVLSRGGGMIGNDSCGATAQRTGKVVDDIARPEVLLYDGTRFWCGETGDEEYAGIEAQGDLRASARCSRAAPPAPSP